MIHKTSDQNIQADPDLSWVTDASEQMNTLSKPTVHWSIFLFIYLIFFFAIVGKHKAKVIFETISSRTN